MTKKELKQYLKNHQLDDCLLNDFIDRNLYKTAIKELPRIIHSHELKILALQSLEHMIDVVIVTEENLKSADVIA